MRESSPPASTGGAVVRSVPVAAVHPGPYQPRGDAAEGVADLVASVREHGLLQPILVRPVGAGFELVAGERRWRAAQQAGLTAVPAVIRELSDREAAVLALVENLQRRELGFFDEAEAYRRVLDEFHLSQEQLAAQLGVSQPGVANKLRLLRLEAEVRLAIVAAGLGERHARAVLRLGTAEERLQAVRAFAAGAMSAQRAEAWVERRLVAAAPAEPAPPGGAPPVQRCVEALEAVVRDLRRAGFAALMTVDEDEEGWTLRLRVARDARERGAGRRRA